MKHFLLATSLTASLLLATTPFSASAQSYPAKPVHVIVDRKSVV